MNMQQAVHSHCVPLARQADNNSGNTSTNVQAVEQELAEAYWRLGQAFATEANHLDQDTFKAAKVPAAASVQLQHACLIVV